MKKHFRPPVFASALIAVLSGIASSSSVEQNGPWSSDQQPDIKEVVALMKLNNKLREEELRNYLVHRVYKLSNLRFNKHSELEVSMKFSSPSRKEFSILSSKGSMLLRKKVLERIIQAEREAAEEPQKRRSAITEDNYKFDLIGTERLNSRPCYILQATPKREDKFLVKGRVWVEANEYAIVRIEGTPVKKPSIWTRKINFLRDYDKIQNFWLPRKDETASDVLIFGRSVLTINYDGYKINFKNEDETNNLNVRGTKSAEFIPL